MKTKLLILCVLFCTLEKAQSSIDYSPSQIGGASLIGIGATVVGYTMFDKNNPPKNPKACYFVGSSMIACGICFLIFGDKEKDEQPKYWNKMETFFMNESEMLLTN